MLQFTISIDQYDVFGYIISKISQEEHMSVHGHQQSDKLDLCTLRGCGPPHVLPCSGWFWHAGVTAHMISCVTSQTRCSHTPEGLDLVGIWIRSCVGCSTYTRILQTAVITTITEGFFPERRINGSVITIYGCRHWDGHALQRRFPWILLLFWNLSNASHWLPLDSRASASESMLQQSCCCAQRTCPHPPYVQNCIQIYITAFNLVAIMKLIVINSLHWTANWMSFLKGSSWSLNTCLEEHHRVHCLIHLMIKT